MPSARQIDRFHVSGFVVLRRVFNAATVDALRTEVDEALRDAYGGRFDERSENGISGHYLPMASRRTPLSTALVCDDHRLMGAAEQLVGAPVVPECPEGVLYFGEAAWHTEDGIGVCAVKFATSFDPLSAATGALRFIPGSHRARPSAPAGGQHVVAADTCDARSDPSWTEPVEVAETEPGDVVAFDVHTRHATRGGRDRLAWTISYQRYPRTDLERQRCHHSILDGFEQAFRGFDRERYPIWRDWLADAGAHPGRGAVIERMRAAGLLVLPGAQVGW
jgi:Phytanoyl-CoA dioxygenase (PhyH)